MLIIALHANVIYKGFSLEKPESSRKLFWLACWLCISRSKLLSSMKHMHTLGESLHLQGMQLCPVYCVYQKANRKLEKLPTLVKWQTSNMCNTPHQGYIYDSFCFDFGFTKLVIISLILSELTLKAHGINYFLSASRKKSLPSFVSSVRLEPIAKRVLVINSQRT